MKNIILYLITSLAFFSVHAQNNDIWTAFWDEDFSLKGYVDANGDTVIKPKFIGSTTANKFKNIIAVVEQKSDGFEYYYLTKSGKIIGRDSLYFFDNTTDCESEGYIRFRDNTSGLVGMFNSNGKVVVPAEYQELSRVSNGFIVALSGAKKKFYHEHEEGGCNHFSWEGGKTQLINTQNEVLIEDFIYEYGLNLFNFSISDQISSDSSVFHFEGLNGKYYQFENFEKSFLNWLENDLLKNPSAPSFTENCADSISYWKNGWQSGSREVFISDNYMEILKVLNSILAKDCDYQVMMSGINAMIYDSEPFDGYLNLCGEPHFRRYPIIEILINHDKDSGTQQDSFGFLKTKVGFKLITVSARSFSLK